MADEEVMGREHRDDRDDRRGVEGLRRLLRRIDDKVVIVVKSGGECTEDFCCCRFEGRICNVGPAFVTLINGDSGTVYIPLNAIAAIIDRDC